MGKVFNRNLTVRNDRLRLFCQAKFVPLPNFFSSLKILASLKNVGLPHFSRLGFWRRKNFVKFRCYMTFFMPFIFNKFLNDNFNFHTKKTKTKIPTTTKNSNTAKILSAKIL